MEAATIVQPSERHVDMKRRAKQHIEFQKQKLANKQKYIESCKRRSQLPAYALEKHIVEYPTTKTKVLSKWLQRSFI